VTTTSAGYPAAASRTISAVIAPVGRRIRIRFLNIGEIKK
jgi:hypothetical protein